MGGLVRLARSGHCGFTTRSHCGFTLNAGNTSFAFLWRSLPFSPYCRGSPRSSPGEFIYPASSYAGYKMHIRLSPGDDLGGPLWYTPAIQSPPQEGIGRTPVIWVPPLYQHPCNPRNSLPAVSGPPQYITFFVGSVLSAHRGKRDLSLDRPIEEGAGGGGLAVINATSSLTPGKRSCSATAEHLRQSAR